MSFRLESTARAVDPSLDRKRVRLVIWPRPTTWAAWDITRIGVGILLLAAALLKAYDLFALPLPGDALVSSRGLTFALIEYEIALGLCLFYGLWQRSVRWLAAGTFTVFSCVTLYRAMVGESTCACFGRASTSPLVTLVIDLSACLALFRWGPAAEIKPVRVLATPRGKAFLLTLIVFTAGTGLAGLRSRRQFTDGILGRTELGSDVVVLEPAKWVGKRFPLLDFIDIGPELATGARDVILYRHDCAVCRDEIPTVIKNARANRGSRVALVEIPPFSNAGEELVLTSPSYASGRLAPARTWFVKTPLRVSLVDGFVVRTDTSPLRE